MPSRKGYAIALALLVAGAAAAAILVFARLSGLTDGLHQVVVPGERELALEEPGRYTVFHESRSIVDGRLFVTPELPGLQFIVVSVAADTALDIAAPSGQVTYSLGGRSGISIGSFEAPAPGRYVVMARYPDGGTEPAGVLAIGKGVGSAIATTILGALGVGFGSFIIAAVIAFRTYRKRRAARLTSAPSHPQPVGALSLALVAACLTMACQSEQPAPTGKSGAVSAGAAASPQPSNAPAPAQSATQQVSEQPRTSNGAVAPAPPPPAADVLARNETNWPGITAEVTELRRKGNTLTATVRFRNGGAERVEPDFYYTDVYLMDAGAGKKYEVLKDEEGRYFAALHQGYGNRWYAYVEPSATKSVWMKFPAPPAELKTITLHIPNVMPFDDLPIQDS